MGTGEIIYGEVLRQGLYTYKVLITRNHTNFVQSHCPFFTPPPLPGQLARNIKTTYLSTMLSYLIIICIYFYIFDFLKKSVQDFYSTFLNKLLFSYISKIMVLKLTCPQCVQVKKKYPVQSSKENYKTGAEKT